MDYVTTLKILVIGESGVGKSSIILAFTTGDYNAQFPATIGVDYKCKVMEVNGVKVKLGIWDTAGQERYRTLTSSFYRDAHGAILVYDVSDPKSLAKLNEWVEELQVYSTKKNIVCLVVGNKIDKPRQVPREAGQAFAMKHRMLFVESSARTQEGITLAFEELVQKDPEEDENIKHHKSPEVYQQLPPPQWVTELERQRLEVVADCTGPGSHSQQLG